MTVPVLKMKVLLICTLRVGQFRIVPLALSIKAIVKVMSISGSDL